MVKVKDLDANHNICALLDRSDNKMEPFRFILPLFERSRIFQAITANTVIIKELTVEFWNNAKLEEECIKSVVKNKEIIVSEQVLKDALELGDESTDPTSLDE